MNRSRTSHELLTSNSALSRSRSRRGRKRSGCCPSMTSGSSPTRPAFEVDRGPLVAGLMDGGVRRGMRGAW